MLRSSCLFGRRLAIRSAQQYQPQRHMFLHSSLLHPPTPLATSSSSSMSSSHAVLLQQRQHQSPFQCGRAFSSTPTPPAAESHEFQAETRQLLDIVIHSVYTDKEVFLRELISNASDALEKLRHIQVSGEAAIADPSLPLEITITTDEEKGTLTLRDTGLGMTKTELVSNLGTIARSGSKAFVKELKEKAGEGTADAAGIIGQFGVGFYSAFMVGDSVEVASRSYSPEEPGHTWKSTGAGAYEIGPVEAGQDGRGSQITIHLKEKCKEFAKPARVKEIIKKYSNFVNFPIKVNGEVCNTVRALWTEDKKDITDDQYKEFYRFIANAYDDPCYRLHFRTDAPLDLKVLFFIPSFHGEKFGMGRLDPGVSLYSRKVLIESKCGRILPDWMRFIKGVVDSEDLPLSISREKAQDTALLKRIERVLVRKVLKTLEDEARKDPATYKEKFFKEFGYFLKEGICHDFENAPRIAKLLYYESSRLPAGESTSFDEYISRCDPEQNAIYFLCAPNRELAEASPYYEAFKRSNKEVIFVYNAIDDFVMNNLKTYHGRDFKTAEATGLDLGPDKKTEEEEDKKDGDSDGSALPPLTEAEAEDLAKWLVSTLPEKLQDAKTTSRLYDSPAIVTDHESGALRRMMRMVEQQSMGQASFVPKQHLEINPRHPIIIRLHALRTEDAELAKVVAEQVFDNAMVAAGLLDDSRVMLPRLNQLIERLVRAGK
ncbi:heat shock protein hsp90 family protein [Nannochloropsis oceanica]